jgi:hypothetical protein
MLEDKLRKYQVMVISEIEKSASQSLPMVSTTPYDKIKYEVEETEQEIVTFSPGSVSAQ